MEKQWNVTLSTQSCLTRYQGNGLNHA